ncbi:MAG: HAD-IA family hydrolase [Desulfuromonadaceae bacterium]|nr:HAD-IA family hydrolase [Desulfuromonadaceae bacterium]
MALADPHCFALGRGGGALLQGRGSGAVALAGRSVRPTWPVLMIRAFLFDLDGTLVDSARDLAESVNRLREELGFTPLPAATALSYVGDGATRLVQRALPEGVYRPEHLPLFLRLYRAHLLDHSRCYPGIVDFLERHRDKKLAVVSNKPHHLAVELLRGTGLLDYFPLILGGDSLTQKKPHPLPVTTALSALGIEADAAIMVGDHYTDLAAAEAAGVRSVFCTYGFGDRRGLPSTWDVHSVSELQLLFP